MNFKIDENLPVEVTELLKQAGYGASTVSEQNLIGTSDKNLAALCQKENRTIVTLDTDFADIKTYPPNNFFGVIVMRLNRQDKPHVLEVFRRVMRLFPTEPIECRLWLVEEDRIRIRS
jgi:predicted nuclease of predicted toxin-antitoxin system